MYLEARPLEYQHFLGYGVGDKMFHSNNLHLTCPSASKQTSSGTVHIGVYML